MLEIYRRFMYRIFWQTATSFLQEGRMEDTVKEHQTILDYVKEHRLQELEDLIGSHLHIAQEINLKIVNP